MKVAAVQFKPDKGDGSGSLRRLCALAEQAAGEADLVVLPEMAVTGYVFAGPEDVAPVAEAADGPTFQVLSGVAARNACWIVVGLPERAPDGRLFNSALVIDASGELAFTYRKTLLYDDDLPWACAGDSGYEVFDTGHPGGRFTVGICMDLNDDGFVDWCTREDIRSVAFPTNWVDEGHRVWGYWAWRMRDTGAALVAANTYGPEAHTAFTGESAIIDGRVVLSAAPKNGDGFIVAELEPVQSPDVG